MGHRVKMYSFGHREIFQSSETVDYFVSNPIIYGKAGKEREFCYCSAEIMFKEKDKLSLAIIGYHGPYYHKQ